MGNRQKFANRDGESLPQPPEETDEAEADDSLNDLLLKEIDRKAKFSTKSRTKRNNCQKGYCNHVLALLFNACKFSLFDSTSTDDLYYDDDEQPDVA